MKSKIFVTVIMACLSLGMAGCAGGKHKQHKQPKEHQGAYKDRVRNERQGYYRAAD